MAAKPFNGKKTVEPAAGFRPGANCPNCAKAIRGLLVAARPAIPTDSREECWYCRVKVDVSQGYGPLEEVPHVLVEETTFPPFIDGKRWVKVGNRLCIKDGDKQPKEVFLLPFRLVFRSVVDDEPRYLVEYGPHRFVGTLKDVHGRLDRDGWILSPTLGKIGLHNLADSCPTVAGAATFGGEIDSEGQLSVPEAFFPSPRGPQAAWMKRLERAIHRSATPQEVAAFPAIGYHGDFQPHEYLPTLGLAALAGWAHVARQDGIVVPFPFLFSRKRRTGKSTIARAYCDRLWATQGQSADALESPFRIAAFLEAGGAWNFNEMEAPDWGELGPLIKAAAESPTFTSRGQADQGMAEYRSRGLLVMTAQRLESQQGPVIDRLMPSRFNENREPTVADMKQLEAALGELTVAGPSLTRSFANHHGTWAKVRAKVDDLATDLDEICQGRLGGRRSLSWAWTYLGLLTIERETQVGRTFLWQAPPLPDFVREVVEPVEQTGRELDRSQLSNFHSWLQRYLVSKTSGHGEEETTRGQGVLFERAFIAGYDVVKITGPVLDQYNQDHRLQPGLQIDHMSDLAAMAGASYGIPHAELYETTPSGDRVRRHMIGGHQKQAVPIPMAEERSLPARTAVLLSIEQPNRRD